jgi:protein O-GlcNAc transferase
MSPTQPFIADLDRARALYDAGYMAEAARAYRAVVSAEPRHAEALWRLGDVANRLGLTNEALALVQASLVHAPNDRHAWNCLGTVQIAAGQPQEAVQAFARAITIAPNFALALSNLGKLYVQLGRVNEAVTAHRHCLYHEPERASHHTDLGNALLAREEWDAALESFLRSLALDAGSAEARLGMGLAQAGRGNHEAAVQEFAQAAKDHPALLAAHHNLALALFKCGRLEEAVDASRAAVARDPGNAKAHANLIFLLDLDPRVDLAKAQAERRRWNDRHARAAVVAPYANNADPDRRLRVGYVSGDLKAHSAAEALAPVILGYSADFDVVCYSQACKPDDVTDRFRRAAFLWREAWQMNDDELEASIRADAIDILVDLSGFTDGNRLAVFARKPAPVQVQAWGYPLGSGMPAMDYLLSDPVLIPEQDRHLFAERIHDLPGFMPFAVPAEGPALAPPPVEANGFITFGSMNRLTKINHEVLRAWAEILVKVPDARLLAKDPGFDDERARARIRGYLAEHGIAADRVELRGSTARRQHLSAYGAVDIALDTFPQSGGITTFESLWMGVPVITLAGDRPQGRASASILKTLGIDQTVAADHDEYVALAVAWARDKQRLHTMRAQLRDRLRRSAFCDHIAYCAAVEVAYREFWTRWCGNTA